MEAAMLVNTSRYSNKNQQRQSFGMVVLADIGKDVPSISVHKVMPNDVVVLYENGKNAVFSSKSAENVAKMVDYIKMRLENLNNGLCRDTAFGEVRSLLKNIVLEAKSKRIVDNSAANGLSKLIESADEQNIINLSKNNAGFYIGCVE